ncbi:hypothetical protein KLP28_06375 [Nocardioidaceae bacterium]|nr:hypothetical protein KLP28_06375 [Nocardioidaceae bacterium]
MRRRWIRSPLPLALLVTLISIAIGLVILFVTGSFDALEPGETRPTSAEVMVRLLSLATAELFVLWGVFWLVRRSRAKSDRV